MMQHDADMQSQPEAAGRRDCARLPFLVEIGSEEIPARFIPAVAAAFEDRFLTLLSEAGLFHSGVAVHATPRRMALLCQELAVRQSDREVVVTGPPANVAFDVEGRPTAAATGFARKNGVEVSACTVTEGKRGAYLAVRKIEPGRSTSEIMQEKMPALLLTLPFPKVMRWGCSDLEYARPLQWLVALLGSDVIPLQLGQLTAGRSSRGHRTLADDRWFDIDSPLDYVSCLEAQSVIVDATARERRITEGIAAILGDSAVAGEVRPDADLLTEVLYLCEFPTPFLGGFDERFFELPDAVIVTALKAHQRYFAVRKSDGSGLLPLFVAVRDGGEHSLATVRKGNERVLAARLADALFYWEFDQRQGPDEHASQLAQVTWIEGFGSLRDKTERLQRLVAVLWEGGYGDGKPVPPAALRAAALCKADLVSEMIKDGKEFTKLEGVMGAHYARQAGEDEAVCRAIERHTMPRGAGEELPGDAISSVLAVADRLDNLAGCWLAGMAPTGAKDPYALRRQALALLRITIDIGARIRLPELLAAAMASFEACLPGRDLEEPAAELREFILTRLSGHLVDRYGLSAEVVRAVLPVHGDDPSDAVVWVRALERFRDRRDFQQLATGFKRCKNILEGQVLTGEDLRTCHERWQAGGQAASGESFSGLTEPAEVSLRDEVARAVEVLINSAQQGDYVEVFHRLSQLGPAIDRFFEEVRVNVTDPVQRRLRHAFLREIHGLFARYADFSEVAPPDA